LRITCILVSNELMKKQKILNIFKNPGATFLLLSVSFGVLFVFLIPPFQAPDELAHFYRSYQISDLHINADFVTIKNDRVYGGYLPKSVHEDEVALRGNISGNPSGKFKPGLYKAFIGHPLDKKDKQFVGFVGSAIYSPAPYIPQATGIFLGELFDLSPLVLTWLGRLFNLTAWIACVYVAIRIIPLAKWALVALALNPLSLFLAASLSADASTIGSIFIFVSLLLKYKQRGTRLSRKEIAILTTVVCLIPLFKPTSLIVCLLVFILPVKAFKNLKNYLIFCLGSLFLATIITLLWNLSVADIIESAGNVMQPGLGVSAHEQTKFIFTHPLKYMYALFNTYIDPVGPSYGDAVLHSFNGTLGWLDTNIPQWTILLHFTVVLAALVYQFGRGVIISAKQKIFIIGVSVATSIAMITALYVGYTKVGASIIQGLQGRYFIPLSILWVPLFTGRKKILNVTEQSFGALASSALFIVLSVTTLTIALRYYA